MPAMRTKEFLELLPDLLRQQLPEDLADFQVAHRITSLTKFYYNRPSFHYEVWIQKRRKEVELGLHFESDPDSNLEQLDLLREKADQIHGSLGDEVELHEWTGVGREPTRPWNLTPWTMTSWWRFPSGSQR